MRAAIILVFGFLPVLVWPAAIETRSEERLDFLHDSMGTVAPFAGKPAGELLSTEEFHLYRTYLKQLQCESAGDLLNIAFTSAYPRFSAARKPEVGRQGGNFWRWQAYAAFQYPEYGFCTGLRGFRIAEARLAEAAVGPHPYRSKAPGETISYAVRDLESRDIEIRILLSVANRDYPPALIFMAALVRRGDLFISGADVEHLLLARACHLGHPCDGEVGERLAWLRARLPADRRRSIDEAARADNLDVENSIVTGKLP